MPSGDYTSAVGGALKIKGVQGSKVDKHNLKKKKKKPKNHREDVPETSTSKKEDATVLQPATKAEADEESRLNDILAEEDGKIEKSEPVTGMSKTETERRFDERRRKTVSILIHHALFRPYKGCHPTSRPAL